MLDPYGIRQAIVARFGSDCGADADPEQGGAALATLLDRRACREFQPNPVPEDLMRLILATGLSAPSKSDLQQADIVWVRDPDIRSEVFRDCGDWVAGAAETLVVCADGRRLARILGPANPNDHFDALFNATGDAAVLLGQLVSAAALAGLGACPVSVVRNRAEHVSDALDLPDRVVPFAGLALGWSAARRAPISPRLGPDATLHIDRFDTPGQDKAVGAYDRRRNAELPYARQRNAERFGNASAYGWSEDKRRQYLEPQRNDWGTFVRAKGFRTD